MTKPLYDLVVVGAGFAGLSAAYHANSKENRIVVVDAGSGTESASYASTAEMNHDPDVDWDSVIKKHGLAKAQSLWSLTEKGISLIEAFARRPGVEHFEAIRVPAHLYSYTPEGCTAIEHKYELYHKLGASAVLHKDGSTIHPNFKAALTISNEGRTNNQALLRTLARGVRARGGTILRHTQCTTIEPASHGVTVHLDGLEPLNARRVLIATGGAPVFERENFAISPTRTFVVRYTGRPLALFFKKSLFWDLDEPFHYTRSFSNAQLWVGGEDCPDGNQSPADTQARIQRIDAYARSVFTLDASYTLTDNWSGVFFPTERSLPYIGTHATLPISYSVGFGGSGLVMSFLSGYLHAEWERGRLTEYKDLFAL